jgi:hypothetical protein
MMNSTADCIVNFDGKEVDIFSGCSQNELHIDKFNFLESYISLNPKLSSYQSFTAGILCRQTSLYNCLIIKSAKFSHESLRQMPADITNPALSTARNAYHHLVARDRPI